MNSMANKVEALVIRGRLLQWFAFGVAGLMLVAFTFLASTDRFDSFTIMFGVVGVLGLLSGWLSHRRQIILGTVVLFASYSVALLTIIVHSENPARDAMMVMPFFLLQVPAAALLFDAKAAVWVGALGLLLIPAVLIGSNAMASFPGLPVVLLMSILTTTGINWLAIRLLERSLAQSEDRAVALGRSKTELQEAMLEVQEHSREAEARRREVEKSLRELQIRTGERDDLAKSLQEATLPVLPVHEQVLVMPLVGAIDTSRANLLNETMLHGIERSRARVIIVDVTGVPLIDTQVAGALLRSANAARLLGARVILVGVRPEVAQTIIGLGLDLSDLIVCSDLQTGIETGLQVLVRSTAHYN